MRPCLPPVFFENRLTVSFEKLLPSRKQCVRDAYMMHAPRNAEPSLRVSMTWSDNPQIRALRMQHKAATDVHAFAATALTAATVDGMIPRPELVEAELKARRVMDEAYAKLLAAMDDVVSAPRSPPAK